MDLRTARAVDAPPCALKLDLGSTSVSSTKRTQSKEFSGPTPKAPAGRSPSNLWTSSLVQVGAVIVSAIAHAHVPAWRTAHLHGGQVLRVAAARCAPGCARCLKRPVYRAPPRPSTSPASQAAPVPPTRSAGDLPARWTERQTASGAAQAAAIGAARLPRRAPTGCSRMGAASAAASSGATWAAARLGAVWPPHLAPSGCRCLRGAAPAAASSAVRLLRLAKRKRAGATWAAASLWRRTAAAPGASRLPVPLWRRSGCRTQRRPAADGPRPSADRATAIQE